MQITFNTNVFTGPLLSGNSFNDTDDEATFSTTAGGTFVWATHLTTETLTANGSGGWTGSLLESGTDTVASSGESTISAAYTATTGTGGESRKFSYYVRDASGNDSNVITETFTVNSANFTDNFTRSNEPLETSADWTQYYVANGGSGDIVSNALKFTGSSGSWDARYELEDTRSSADQYVEATVASWSAGTDLNIRFTLRATPGTPPSQTGYQFSWNLQSGVASIHEVTAGSATLLAGPTAHSLGASGVIRAEANGTTLRLLAGGSEILSVTDSTHTGIGQLLVRSNAFSSASNVVIDDLTYGDL